MVDTTPAGTDHNFGSPAMITWNPKGARKRGGRKWVRTPEMLTRTRCYPENGWMEVTGTCGVVWVIRCSGDLLGAAAERAARRRPR